MNRQELENQVDELDIKIDSLSYTKQDLKARKLLKWEKESLQFRISRLHNNFNG
jgi:hypothetical protein